MATEKAMTPEEVLAKLKDICWDSSASEDSLEKLLEREVKALRLWRTQLWTEAAEAMRKDLEAKVVLLIEEIKIAVSGIGGTSFKSKTLSSFIKIRQYITSTDSVQIVAELEKKSE